MHTSAPISAPALLPALFSLPAPIRSALTLTLDLADEAAQRGDRAVYARILHQVDAGQPLPVIAAQLAAERDQEER